MLVTRHLSLVTFEFPLHRGAKTLTIAQRVADVRTGFDRAFWVANFTELFERLAYYGASAVLAIYLTEQLHFSKELTGLMMGVFGFTVWFLPVVGGTLADRFGFRRSLMFAYLVMTVGYFLMGSLAAPWMAPARHALGDKALMFCILLIPAIGPAMVKPCVAGTTACASTEHARTLGYSIYYTVVNIGGTLGPVVGWFVREKLGLGAQRVFIVSSVSVFLMFCVTLFFFDEPKREIGKAVPTVLGALKNTVAALRNFKFLLFLLIFSSFYIVFWQEFIAAPLFLRGYVNPNANADLVLATDGLTVICFQVLVTHLTRNIPTFRAMTLGLIISSLSWLVLVLHPTTAGLIVALIVLALGEITQSARYYDYLSRLAPPGQQGLYMGCAFLPIGIGYLVAGPLGTYLLHEFGDVLHRPRQMWWVVTGVGLLGAVLMVIYDRVFKPAQAKVEST